jgi:hypothetical protein
MIRLILITLFTNIITFKRQRNLLINNTLHQPLEDIIHSNYYFKNLNLKKEICDIFPFICIFLIKNYKKFIDCYSYLILLRFICFHLTILPPPMKLKNRLSFSIIPNYTYDFIFSGHTMTCVLSIFCTNKSLILYCFLLSLLCSLSVIVSKEHYTIDVIVAWISTYSVVSLYTIDIQTLLK